MFKHILVPVDGSSTSLLAVDKAIQLARAFNGRITVINVIDPYPFVGVGSDFAYGQTEYLTAAKASANQALTAAADAAAAAGLECTQRIIEGQSVFEGILEGATGSDIDLIIMGSHGRQGIQKLLLGSETQRVLAHTTLPVLVVRG